MGAQDTGAGEAELARPEQERECRLHAVMREVERNDRAIEYLLKGADSSFVRPFQFHLKGVAGERGRSCFQTRTLALSRCCLMRWFERLHARFQGRGGKR